MPSFDDLERIKPEGRRTAGSSQASTKETLHRKVAIARRVLLASLRNEVVRQKADLAALSECAAMQSVRGIGEFLGKAKTGLDLDLVRTGKDWLIEPSPWQAYKAWRWLKANDSSAIFGDLDLSLPQMAMDAGFPSVAALEAEITSRIEAQQPNAAAVQESAVDDDEDVQALLTELGFDELQ